MALSKRQIDLTGAARVLFGGWGISRRVHWPAEKIADYQRRQLESLFAYFGEHSPYYKKLGLGRTTKLQDWPAWDKRDHRDNFDELVTDRRVKLADVEAALARTTATGELNMVLDEYLPLHTSGTSGVRGIILYDRSMVLRSISLLLGRFMPLQPKRPKDPKTVILGAATHAALGRALPDLVPFGGRKININAGIGLDAIVEKLNELDPTHIGTYPSTVEELVSMQRAGKLKLKRLVSISCGGELLTRETRQRAIDTFGCRVLNVYGTTEAGYIAADCKLGQLHLAEDSAVVEVVDSDGKPVPDGTLGDGLLVTSIWNRVLPLIRLRLNDRVRVSKEQCPCGSGLRWIEEIEGRRGVPVEMPDKAGNGVPIQVWKLVDVVNAAHNEVAGSQFVLEQTGRLRVNVVLRDPAQATDVEQAIRRAVEKVLARREVDVARVALDFKPVHELERLPGSYKTFAFRSLL